jgi:integrase
MPNGELKATKAGRKILYLDFYPPITVNGKQTRREYLGLFVFDPLRHGNPFDKDHNIKANEEAELKRTKRFNELNKPEIYSDFELDHLRKKEIGEGSFTDYLKKFVIKKNSLRTWLSVELHVNKFAGKELTFADVTEKFCNGFKEYLITAVSINNDILLLKNSASSYFCKFKTVLRRAYKDGCLPIYLNDKIGSIGTDETRRNYLTIDELNKLVKAECSDQILKRAALFSALTGLRYSDIEKLTWKEVELIGEDYILNFTQRKTGGVETLPISKQAAALLGGRDQVTPFAGLRYNAHRNILLKNWITSVGITKKITFHCFRHTYATLQLDAGTDIYTVSKMLGHRDLKTTQIYAKVVNKAKREAAERITLDI